MTDIGERICRHIAISVGMSLAAAQIAFAGDFGVGQAVERQERALPSGPWTLTFTPYAWAPYLQGDLTVRGRTVGLDVTPSEVFEHLERAPWMSYAEVRNGRLALYNDIFYAKLGISVSGARLRGASTVDATLGADFEEAVIEAGGAYQIAKWWSGRGGSIKDSDAFTRYTVIDLLAGARYWHQEMAINLALTGTLDPRGLDISGGRATARSGAVDWVDPLVGFRVRHQLAPGRELMFRADVGGFDVGSKFSWNLIGAYSWDICVSHGVTYSGMVGYRALSVDFEKGSGVTRYEYDVVQHGPVMGLAIKF
jgi:hypothetical protein